MGLLERALREKSQPTPDEPEKKPRRGLLARALSFRGDRTATPEIQIEETQAKKSRGLFARAFALREKSETVKPRGLFARALQSREEESPAARSSGLLGRAEAMRNAPRVEEPAIETAKFAEPEMPAFRSESALPDHEFDNLDAPPFEPGLSTDGTPADLGLSSFDDSPLDLPDISYEGPSAPELDPALAIEEHETETHEDPFTQWEKEAEAQAEQEAASLDRPVGKRTDLLYEDESQFTTAPVEAHIASQKKIDNYLALFDITKEITAIEDYSTLWDTVMYAVMGQVGSESICIFSSAQKMEAASLLYPVSHTGMEVDEDWVLKPGDEIYDRLSESQGILHVPELMNSAAPLSPLERRMIQSSGAFLFVPLKHQQKMFGIIMLGRPVGENDYSIDDLEFLTLLGEIAAVGVDRVLARVEHERDTQDLRKKNEVYLNIFDVARKASTLKNLDELYDLTNQILDQDFSVLSFSLVLLSPAEQEYRIFAGNQISPESLEKFRLSVASDLIGLVSNLTRVYDLADFRSNREINACYTNDDLALMQNYWIVPLINLNWLVGFITIHRTKTPWTEFQRELIVSLSEVLAPVYANCIILGERETLFRDPFSPVEDRLKLELKKTLEFRSSMSLVEIRVKNIKRLVTLNPPGQISEFLLDMSRTISGFLFESDFMARIGQGRFAVILPGRTAEEAEIFTRKVKAEFKRLRLLSQSPLEVQYAHNIITAPADTDDPGKMLSILE